MIPVRQSVNLVLRNVRWRPYYKDLRPNDVAIASYPRSGSTWLRFMLFHILTGRPADFELVDRVIPDIGNHGKALRLLPEDGRLIKTHYPYYEAHQKAIYLVRDSRDVVISEYAFNRMRGAINLEFHQFLMAFLRGRANRYGSWADHVQSWLEADPAKRGDVLVVKFEDMRQDVMITLERILEFLGVQANGQVIEDAIKDNSIQRMRHKEEKVRETDKMWKKLQRDIRFVNKGAVGGWQGQLSDEQMRLMEQATGEVLDRLGYLSGNPARH